jgi:hypothetical protein
MLLDSQLCDWLRMNSSGIYRPAAQAAIRIEELSEEVEWLKKEVSRLVIKDYDRQSRNIGAPIPRG